MQGSKYKQDAAAYDPLAAAAEKQEIDTLLKRVRLDALTAKASELRGGIPYRVPAVQDRKIKRSSVMGGMNYHIDIEFDNGTVWLARIRRFNATSPPPVLRDHIFRSEVATLKFLERTTVPTPKVFEYALEGENNPVGVGYMLTEKLPGSSLRWSRPLTPERKVIEQLADIFIELQKYPFDKIGSLDSPGSSHLGVFAQESLTDFDQDSHMPSLGPYTSLQEYHTASIQFILDLILRDELYSHRPIDAYLIHRFLLDLVPSMLPSDESSLFFLKHADDKGDHILVNEEFNITGIIDWEWAYTAPAALAFNSPIMLLPVAHFYDGANNIGEQEEVFAQIFEDKGHPSLASIVRNGRLQHRFAFCCGYDLWNDWGGFQGLFQGLREAVNNGAGMNWDQWKAHAIDRYGSDEGLQFLISRGKT